MTATLPTPSQALHRLTKRWREHLTTRILATVGPETNFDEYRYPEVDPGLFGPGSVAWTVHRDLPAMLIGGISALMLQTLHPRAMAGIADHSNFREDPLGRLHRTARFVAGTTFGPTPLADQLIATVTRIHRSVVGKTADGTPYAATDPELLTWVHITEVSSFVRAYLELGPKKLSPAQVDQYFAEVSILAERLGATHVPKSTAEVARYFDEIRPSLSVTPEAIEAVAFLRTPVAGSKIEHFAHRVVLSRAICLLPAFARHELNLSTIPGLSRALSQAGARVFGGIVRWALGPSRIAAIAEARMRVA